MSYSISGGQNPILPKVMLALAITMIPTVAGIMTGINFIGVIASMGWLFPILAFIGIIIFATVLSGMKDSPVAYLALMVFTFFMGIIMSGGIYHYLSSPEGINIIIKAFSTTIILFLVMGFIGANTKKDLSSMGRTLMIVLIGVIVAAIVNIFLASTLMSFIISAVSAVIFSLFIMYDINRVCNGGVTSVVQATVALYLDFVNLFMSLLNIFGLSKN